MYRYDKTNKKENGLKFDYFWIDAGWFGKSTVDCPNDFEGRWWDRAGDWNINTYFHPNGLEDVSRTAKAAGMKFLLWFEFERAMYTTPIPIKHPEYFLGTPYKNGEDRGARILNLGNEKAWKYCFDMLCEKIERLKIDCVRQDFNIGPIDFWRGADSGDRMGITEIKYIMGLYRLWDSLLEKFPSLIIDNCASGGRRIDVEALKRTVPLWRSDVTCMGNYPPEFNQMHNINFNTWLPYNGTGGGRIIGDTYRIRSAYASSLEILYFVFRGDDFPTDKSDIEWIKRYLNEYKKVRPYFSCDLYPLTSISDSVYEWCAAQYDRPEKSDGIIQVFKREKSPYITGTFKLGNIDCKKNYVFIDADDNSKVEICGADLIENGFRVEIKGERVAKIYFYNAIGKTDLGE